MCTTIVGERRTLRHMFIHRYHESLMCNTKRSASVPSLDALASCLESALKQRFRCLALFERLSNPLLVCFESRFAPSTYERYVNEIIGIIPTIVRGLHGCRNFPVEIQRFGDTCPQRGAGTTLVGGILAKTSHVSVDRRCRRSTM